MEETIKNFRKCISESCSERDSLKAKLVGNLTMGERNKIKRSLAFDPKTCLCEEVNMKGYSSDEISRFLRDSKQESLNLSDNLSLFLRNFKEIRNDFFGKPLSISLCPNNDIIDLIEEECLPKYMMCFLLLGRYDSGDIGMWLYEKSHVDSEVIYIDDIEDEIIILSNSFENFIRRGIFCFQNNVIPEFFNPSKEALKPIQAIEEGNGLEVGEKYSLSNTSAWPKHWQKILY